MKELGRENRELRRANEILNGATFIGAESDHRSAETPWPRRSTGSTRPT